MSHARSKQAEHFVLRRHFSVVVNIRDVADSQHYTLIIVVDQLLEVKLKSFQTIRIFTVAPYFRLELNYLLVFGLGALLH